MPRFFVNTPLEGQDTIFLDSQQAAHVKVLRLSCGDSVTVSDGKGCDCLCTITRISSETVTLSVDSITHSEAEPKVFASVYMAFAKGDKFEHVIQKATELGASEIIGFPSSRCVAKYDAKMLAKKLARWQKIAEAAAEQSGRGTIPEVLTAASYRQALERAATADRALFFYENERSHTLSESLEGDFHSVALVSGPEGGFSTEETQLAEETGLQVCTLGKRILRCETAPLCALSAVMFATGEF